MQPSRFARKTALFLILLLLIFHWLVVSPAIRKYRTRIPSADPWRNGADILTQLPTFDGNLALLSRHASQRMNFL